MEGGQSCGWLFYCSMLCPFKISGGSGVGVLFLHTDCCSQFDFFDIKSKSRADSAGRAQREAQEHSIPPKQDRKSSGDCFCPSDKCAARIPLSSRASSGASALKFTHVGSRDKFSLSAITRNTRPSDNYPCSKEMNSVTCRH